MRTLFVAALGAAALLIPFGAALAHEGHDHAEQTVAPAPNSAARGEATGTDFELVAVARTPDLLIYLDSFKTNAPVEGATIEAETPAGAVKATAQPGQPYILAAPWLSKPGKYDLIFTVTANNAAEILPVTLEVPVAAARDAARTSFFNTGIAGWLTAGGLGLVLGIGLTALTRRRGRSAAVGVALLTVLAAQDARAHEGEDHSKDAAPAPSVARERAQRLTDGTLFVPKDTQRIFALRTVLSEQKAHPRSIELPGRIIADPNASGFVQSAVGGRLSAPPGGFPRLGTVVKQGDVLAYITPPLQAIDVSDMRQRQGELEQQMTIVERRVTRYAALAPSGAVSKVQLEEANLELEGLKERRKALERSKAQPEALMAPVSGIVADGMPIAGQIAQSNGIIFNIIDPARLWIEALSFDAISDTQASASALLPNGKTLKLSFQGAGLADRNQTVPIHFAIEDKPEGIRVGQFVPVLVVTGEDKPGIAVPRTAIVRSTNGQDFVYEHVSAERFAARPVRIETLDSARVLVVAGMEPGKRIVVQGAELLDQIR
ncbi:MAG: transporter [Xanthobacteraceae bacterium]|nr:transporter [Xanthobacteraceae bacterium]